jgi:hypothetical protein
MSSPAQTPLDPSEYTFAPAAKPVPLDQSEYTFEQPKAKSVPGADTVYGPHSSPPGFNTTGAAQDDETLYQQAMKAQAASPSPERSPIPTRYMGLPTAEEKAALRGTMPQVNQQPPPFGAPKTAQVKQPEPTPAPAQRLPGGREIPTWMAMEPDRDFEQKDQAVKQWLAAKRYAWESADWKKMPPDLPPELRAWGAQSYPELRLPKWNGEPLGEGLAEKASHRMTRIGRVTGGDIGEAAANPIPEPELRTASPKVQQTMKNVGAAGRGIGSFVGGTAADPTNLMLLTGVGALPKLGQRLAALGFAFQLGKGAYEKAGQIGEVWDRSDIPQEQKVEMVTDLILNTAMAAASASHGLRPGEPRLTTEQERQMLAEVDALGEDNRRQIEQRIQEKLGAKNQPQPIQPLDASEVTFAEPENAPQAPRNAPGTTQAEILPSKAQQPQAEAAASGAGQKTGAIQPLNANEVTFAERRTSSEPYTGVERRKPVNPVTATSRVPELRRDLLQETEPGKRAEIQQAIDRESQIASERTPEMEKKLEGLTERPISSKGKMGEYPTKLELVLGPHQTPYLTRDGLATDPTLPHNEQPWREVGNRDIHAYMQHTGYVRLMGAKDELGVEMVSPPSPAQIDAIQRAAGGNKIVWDISNEQGKIQHSGTAADIREFEKSIAGKFTGEKPIPSKVAVEKPSEKAPVYEQHYQGPLDIETIKGIKDSAQNPDVRRTAQAVFEAVTDSGMKIEDAMNLNGTDELAKEMGGRFNVDLNEPDEAQEAINRGVFSEDQLYTMQGVPPAFVPKLLSEGILHEEYPGENEDAYRITGGNVARLDARVAELMGEHNLIQAANRVSPESTGKPIIEGKLEQQKPKQLTGESDITKPQRVVPGGKSAYTGKETGISDLEELTQSIANQKSAKTLNQRIEAGINRGQETSAKDAISQALGKAKGVMAALFDAYKRPVRWTAYEDATGKWSGAEQRAALSARRFADTITKQVPDKLTREAISNWIEADGDENILRARADKSKEPYKAGYEKALELTDEQKTIARNIANFHEATGQEAIKTGVMQHAVENYVQHIYKDKPEMLARIRAEQNFASLQTKPSFSKQRTLPTYFDAEQLGFTPKNKDVAYLTVVHEQALREAIAARNYIRSLMEGKDENGRPLAAISWASAKEVSGKDAEGNQRDPAYLITPNLKPGEEFADYRKFDHPALRDWRWAGEIDGKPVFVKGDAVLNPSIYRKVKNNLSTSAIRNYSLEVAGHEIQPGAMALKAQSELKHVILSYSGFHQTQLGLHALEHTVKPAFMPELDLNQPKQGKLVDHGLNVAQFDAEEQLGEGVASGGVVTKVPGIGPVYKTYTNYLFNSYLPRLKMQMALDALERNQKTYAGKLTEDQIYAQTAKEANAAFGGLNYKLLGRNKTFQDALRLALMAPDFFEARARFVGQALRPYGREQLRALLIGAVVLYTAGRLINQASDGEPHWDKPFSVVHKGKEYSLRTIQGDLVHLATDPQQFLKSRLGPVPSLLLKDDKYQRKNQSAVDNVKARAGSLVPVPLQPWLRPDSRHHAESNTEKAVDSILKMIGVNEKVAK